MPHLLYCYNIWDKAPHNAFTDLIFYRKHFYCCFREGKKHAGCGSGQIRVVASLDGIKWESISLITEKGIDLRDPMLSITPEGKWMLNMGGTLWEGDHQVERASYVCFSDDGMVWTSPKKLPYKGEWIWRVTWYKNKGYGASYLVDKDSKYKLSLMVTEDGLKYRCLHVFDLPHCPNETTLRFLKDDTLVALVRTHGPHGMIGHSKPPYDHWQWYDTKHRLGGPNFLILDDRKMWACSRKLVPLGPKKFHESMVLAKMSLRGYKPVLELPSGGDCSYPGMVEKDGMLYVSYYSSHEGKSKIYFACIDLEG